MPVPTTLIAPFKLYTYASDESQPVVVASPDGRIATYWSSVVGAENDVYSYTYQGNFFGPNGAGAVNAGSGIYSGDIEANPDGAFLANGNAIIAYEKVVAGNRDIYFDLRTKNTDGTYTSTLTSQLVNSASVTGNQYMPEAVRLADGGLAISWQDSNDGTIKAQRYTAAGAANGAVASFTPSSNQIGGDFNHDMIGLAGGGFAVSYRSTITGSVAMSAVNGAGTALVTDLVVSSQATGASHGATSLAQLANGNIVAAWYDSDGGGVGYRVFNSSFGPQTSDQLIPSFLTGGYNAIGETPRIAAMLDGRFMVVFSGNSSGGVIGQMLTAAGALDGASFTISSAFGHQAEIETLADGRVMVTWRDSGDIYGAMYDPREAGVTITGTTGSDNYVGSDFGDTISTSTGDDFILGNGGADSISGGSGLDTIYGGSGNNTIVGGDQNDLIVGGIGNELLQGGFDSDTIFGEGGNDAIYGMLAADPNGSGFGDVLIGGAGSDSIYGSGGADYLYGGLDNDSLEGGANADVLLGDAGIDTLRGGDGNDYLFSGDGVNFMYGDAGIDVFISEGGSDLMVGGSEDNFYYRVAAGSSQINGGAGSDQFVGGSALSNDGFYGGDGGDFAFGGDGNDLLVGQGGGDVLIGQNGNDTLDGGAGVNLLWANDAGSDEIRVNVGDGGTQVVDFFEAGGTNDYVRILGSSLTSFAGIQNLVANLGVAQGNNLMVNVSFGSQLYLNLGANQTAIWFQGINALSLTSADFLFS
jgi:Ca2+-binding RTX toxin-like protein